MDYATTSNVIHLPVKTFICIYICIRIKFALQNQSNVSETANFYDLDINMDFIFHCRKCPTISNSDDHFSLLVQFAPQGFFALGGSLSTWQNASLSCATARSQARAEETEFMVIGINVPYTLNEADRLQGWDLQQPPWCGGTFKLGNSVSCFSIHFLRYQAFCSPSVSQLI